MFDAVYVFPSIHVKLAHAVLISVPVFTGLIVRFNVTIESHPFLATNVCVAVVFDAVYVFPSIHVKLAHAVLTSVPVFTGLIVRFKVTIESHPFLATNL